MSDSLQPQELQHTMLPCSSLSPGDCLWALNFFFTNNSITSQELSKNFMGILIIINKSNNLKFTMSAFNETLLGYKEAGLKDI